MFFRIPRIVPLFALACISFLSGCIGPESPSEPTPAFRAYFLDVGQGDACLMRTPSGDWVLFDAGNEAERLIPFLENVRVDTLSAVFISHPDLDHFGALPTLLKEIPIKKVFLPVEASGSSPDPAWSALLAGLDAFPVRKETLFAGDTLLWSGDVHVRVLWPFPHTDLSENDHSTVLRVEFKSRRILLTGDIEEAAETAILAAGIDPRADILKVAHHGSRTSNGLPFLEAVAPHWAVISCDSAVYGHPHPEALADLVQTMGDGSRILRTDREGTIGFELDEWGIRRIGTEKGALQISN
jgi:competence protein ComEC